MWIRACLPICSVERVFHWKLRVDFENRPVYYYALMTFIFADIYIAPKLKNQQIKCDAIVCFKRKPSLQIVSISIFVYFANSYWQSTVPSEVIAIYDWQQLNRNGLTLISVWEKQPTVKYGYSKTINQLLKVILWENLSFPLDHLLTVLLSLLTIAASFEEWPREGNKMTDLVNDALQHPFLHNSTNDSLPEVDGEQLLWDSLENERQEYIMNCSNPDIFNVTQAAPIQFASVMYGGIMPVLVTVTLLANSLIIAVLTRRHMKTPTNLVLLWMAVADLLTLLSPAPWYFYMYTLGQHVFLLKSSFMCYVYHVMTEHVPILLHNSSIWLTCILAFQR